MSSPRYLRGTLLQAQLRTLRLQPKHVGIFEIKKKKLEAYQLRTPHYLVYRAAVKIAPGELRRSSTQ